MRTEEEVRAKTDKLVKCPFRHGCTPYICLNCREHDLCGDGREFGKWVLNDKGGE